MVNWREIFERVSCSLCDISFQLLSCSWLLQVQNIRFGYQKQIGCYAFCSAVDLLMTLCYWACSVIFCGVSTLYKEGGGLSQNLHFCCQFLSISRVLLQVQLFFCFFFCYKRKPPYQVEKLAYARDASGVNGDQTVLWMTGSRALLK